MHIDNNIINYTEKIIFYYINYYNFFFHFLCNHQRQFEFRNIDLTHKNISNQLQMIIDISTNI